VGGVDPAAGGGLRGLDDRVATVGGTLAIDSPVGGGTRLEARMPV
jgi:signal transduction histidine kinase